MSKELNIIQAMQMPVGTEFEILSGEGNCEGKIIIKEAPTRKCDSRQMYWIESNEPVIIGDYSLSVHFKPIQKPVSFMEAIKASQEGKIIRVEIENKTFVYYPRSNKYLELVDKGSNGLSTWEVLEGKWYIESEEN